MGQLGIGSQILLEIGTDFGPPGRIIRQQLAVESLQRQGEPDKVAEMGERFGTERAVFMEHPHCIDDDGRIPEPVEEVIGIGIPVSEHRGCDNGASFRHNGLAEAGPGLDDADRRNGFEYRFGGKPILPVDPGLE